MLAGVGDDDIRREVLSTEDMFFNSFCEIFIIIESKEIQPKIYGLYQQSLVFRKNGCSNVWD